MGVPMSTVDSYVRNIEQLSAENDKLRSLLANGSDPCIYCGLPKNDIAKCEHGFPECARADDMLNNE
jgi:hypothetical protein